MSYRLEYLTFEYRKMLSSVLQKQGLDYGIKVNDDSQTNMMSGNKYVSVDILKFLCGLINYATNNLSIMHKDHLSQKGLSFLQYYRYFNIFCKHYKLDSYTRSFKWFLYHFMFCLKYLKESDAHTDFFKRISKKGGNKYITFDFEKMKNILCKQKCFDEKIILVEFSFEEWFY